MRILLIGCVEFSSRALDRLIELQAVPVGVITRESSPGNADFVDLAPTCHRHGIPWLHTAKVNAAETLGWVRQLRPDIIFCFGWSNLIQRELLGLPPLGVIGFHPAALPRNRGRHPLIWALALGLERTASSFFYMDEGADSGDLLDQAEIAIDLGDTAADLYRKVTETALRQIEDFLPRLRQGTAPRIPQDHSLANLWRKRSAKDGQIDFRMPSRAIYNLVRALSPPYPGAHLLHQGGEIKVWASREESRAPANLEPGKVLAVEQGEVLVKCADGGIWLTRHGFEQLPQTGDYLS